MSPIRRRRFPNGIFRTVFSKRHGAPVQSAFLSCAGLHDTPVQGVPLPQTAAETEDTLELELELEPAAVREPGGHGLVPDGSQASSHLREERILSSCNERKQGAIRETGHPPHSGGCRFGTAPVDDENTDPATRRVWFHTAPATKSCRPVIPCDQCEVCRVDRALERFAIPRRLERCDKVKSVKPTLKIVCEFDSV